MVEAVALHDFSSTQDEDLPFKKGNLLKILDKNSDPNWYKAELNGREGLVPKNYVSLKEIDWYNNKMSRQQAADFLLGKNYEGAFLIRDSEASPGDFSVSVKHEQGVQHFKVLRDGVGKYFLWLVKFSSLNELVNYHRTSRVSRGAKIFLKDEPKVTLVRAKYDFVAQEEGELSVKKGDIITLVDQSDSNWWKGHCHGKEGLFPKSYVEMWKE